MTKRHEPDCESLQPGVNMPRLCTCNALRTNPRLDLARGARVRANEAVIRLHLAAHLESSDADVERDAALESIGVLAEQADLLNTPSKARWVVGLDAELTRLREENERLRAALEAIAGDDMHGGVHLNVAVGSDELRRIAREALEEKPR